MIENWRNAWKFWSLQLQAVGLVLITFPELILDAWVYLPVEVKSMLPTEYSSFVGLFLIIAGMVARLIKQRSLNETKP